jgi:hypothetical protein
MQKNYLAASVLLFLVSAGLQAQINGAVSGIIVDASGGGVPDASVVLASVETGETRSQTSDHEGRFAFHLLKIGDYEVKANAAGFKQSSTTATVRSGETSAVTLRLEVGQVTESISVTDAVNPLDTADAQIQVSLESRQVLELPMRRNAAYFALTSPGVVPVNINNPFLGPGSFNTHGSRGRANNITIDNITSTDIVTTGVGGTQLGPLNYEQIKEVKLITSNFNAEYGRNAGSQFQFITRSGTNDLHGRVYHFFQNDKLNARDFFDRSGKPTVTRNNEIGFTLGGPILRNRTHYFLTHAHNPVRGLGGTRIAQVPTPEMVAQVTDPTSKSLLDSYQLPVSSTGQAQQSAPSFQDAYQFSVRIDHQFSERDTLNARYGHFYQEGSSVNNTFIGTNLAGFGANFVNGPRNFNLAETHLFSPTVVNEFRFGFGRVSPYFAVQASFLGPRIDIINGAVDRFGESENIPQGRAANTFQYSDTLSWAKGAHNLKVGADVFRYQLNSLSDAAVRGIFRFATWQDFAAGHPASYVQRFGSTVRGNRVTNHFYFIQDDWRVRRGLTINLGLRTEVAGGVNEVNGLISNLDLECQEPIGAAGSGPFGCFTTGKPSNGTNVNWGPRAGFAWTPWQDGRTVIRGGYGIVYDFLFLNPIINQRALPPFLFTASLTGPASFTGANSWASLVAGTAQVQADGRASTGKLNPSARNFGVVNPAIDPNLRNPQTQQWSFGVERELFESLVLKATYVGAKSNYLQRTHALNLLQDARLTPAASVADETAKLPGYLAAVAAGTGNSLTPSNRIDPRFNDVNLIDSSANSNYHGFEVLAHRAFRGGLWVQAGYTFSKSIDDVSDALGGALINDSSGQQNPRDNRDNRGVSQFDVPHRLVVTHVWELPFGKRLRGALLRRLATGWSFAGASSIRSGFPVTFEAGARRGITPLTLTGVTSGPVRPNAARAFVFEPRPAGSQGAPNGLTADPVQPLSAYAASLGLSQPLLGGFGSLGRNTHRLNAAPAFDWSISKNTSLTERVTLQLRAELYNVFNTTVFQDVNRTITSATFGQYTTTAQSTRWIQLGARLMF